MIGDLFDSPWKILIVALVIIVLFGSKKLPSAARSLGQSMRILKKEVQGLHEDEPEPPAAAAAEISHPTPAVGLPNPGVSADRIKRFGHSRDLGHVTYRRQPRMATDGRPITECALIFARPRKDPPCAAERGAGHAPGKLQMKRTRSPFGPS